MAQKLAPNKNQRLQVKIIVISYFWATIFWTIIGTLSEFSFKKNRFKIKLRLKKNLAMVVPELTPKALKKK